MGVVRALFAIALCAALASCGGAKRPAMSPTSEVATVAPGTAAEPTQVMPGTPRTEIDELWAKIEQERQTLGLTEPAPDPMPAAPERMSSVPMSTDASCRPAKTERCTSSCTLSDSICRNADRICELALGMPGDTWAAGKCARAKQTCESAHQSCCSCQ